MLEKMRRRTWTLMAVAQPGDRPSRIVDVVLLILILLNVVVVLLETVDSIWLGWRPFFLAFEYVSVTVFATEYLLRLWSCTSETRFSHPFWGRLKYIVTPMALIDLLAILPSLLVLNNLDLRCLRVFRLTRIVLLIKTGRYVHSLQVLGRVFMAKKEELVMATGLLTLLLVVSSAIMYYIENAVQPEAFSSIPATMWYAVATLTTVGYGDVAPVTYLGKLLGGLVAVMGIGLFALPTSILGSGFLEEYHKSRKRIYRCPHCEREIDLSHQ